jgi:hypothetical protein
MRGIADIATVPNGTGFDEWQGVITPEYGALHGRHHSLNANPLRQGDEGHERTAS